MLRKKRIFFSGAFVLALPSDKEFIAAAGGE
jgi:hypothetical protein